jgi:hypothetical protein
MLATLLGLVSSFRILAYKSALVLLLQIRKVVVADCLVICCSNMIIFVPLLLC